jgi:hypothetical protein
LIVEGEVILTQCYIDETDEIYTANKIKVNKIMKGAYEEEYLTIVTMGGSFGSKQATWFHMLTLSEGERGTFFLFPTKRPMINSPNFPDEVFEVYSSMQGFIAYSKENGKLVGEEVFHRYNDIGKLYQEISSQTGQIVEIVSPTREEIQHALWLESFTGDDCIIYSLELPTESMLDFEFSADLYVRTVSDTFPLYEAYIVLQYNTAVFGDSVVSNGVLTVSNGVLATLSEYSLQLEDFTYNKVRLTLNANTIDAVELYKLTEQKAHICQLHLALDQIPQDAPQVGFNKEDMESNSKYIDASTSTINNFDCVDGEGGIGNPFASPVIDSIVNLVVAGGVSSFSKNNPPVLGTVEIYGKNFGSPTPGNIPDSSYVLFKNIGPDANQWVGVLPGDFVGWSDTKIRAKVPSVGFKDTTSVVSNESYAGTGQIRVIRPDGQTTSTQTVVVKFSAFNFERNVVGVPLSSAQVYLYNKNGNGGYDLFLDNTISGLPDSTKLKEAFLRALNTWRCATLVNFKLKNESSIADTSQACRISFGSTPVGLLAKTVVRTSACEVNGNVLFRLLERFEMVFKNTVAWHADTTMPVLNWSTAAGFETASLHELGHGHLLNHVSDTTAVMWFKANKYKHSLIDSDSLGGDHIVKLSNGSCGATPAHVPLNLTNCHTSTATQNVLAAEHIISIYPNPVSDDVIKVETEGLESNFMRLCLYDSFGRRIKCDGFQNLGSQILFKLPEKLPSGIYVLSVENQEGMFMGRLIQKF